MADSHGDIELRAQVALSSSDVAAARVLASGADHDVSEVRAELRAAHTQALNALRETQLDLKVNGRDQKVTGFAMLGTGMAQITALLTPNTGSGQN